MKIKTHLLNFKFDTMSSKIVNQLINKSKIYKKNKSKKGKRKRNFTTKITFQKKKYKTNAKQKQPNNKQFDLSRFS